MLYRYLDDMISVGRLTVAIGNEQPFSVGAIPIDLPRLDIAIRVKDRWTANLIALDPEYQLGQAWMDGALTIEQGSLDGFMDLIGRNMFEAFPSDPDSTSYRQLRGSLEKVVREKAADHLMGKAPPPLSSRATPARVRAGAAAQAVAEPTMARGFS